MSVVLSGVVISAMSDASVQHLSFRKLHRVTLSHAIWSIITKVELRKPQVRRHSALQKSTNSILLSPHNLLSGGTIVTRLLRLVHYGMRARRFASTADTILFIIENVVSGSTPHRDGFAKLVSRRAICETGIAPGDLQAKSASLYRRS